MELADGLALVALGDQRRGEVAVEHHGHAALHLRGKAGLLRGLGEYIVLLQLHGNTV